MTLDELDRILAARKIGSVTLNIAANGKAYATVYLPLPNGQFHPENQWAASSAEALEEIFERLDNAPPQVIDASSTKPETGLSGLLV